VEGSVCHDSVDNATLTAVVLAAIYGFTDLAADIGALSRDVAEIKAGVLSSSQGREGGDESGLSEEHIEWLRFDLLEVNLMSSEWLSM
jgi:hypothetical protein